MSNKSKYVPGIKKPQLVELLTDIVTAASGSGNVDRTIKLAKNALEDAGLWTNPLPIVNSNKGADIYGYATSPHYAKIIAEECDVGVVDHVECYGPVTLTDGTTHEAAYVVVTKPPLLEARAQ
jgi:hypothetical protein